MSINESKLRSPAQWRKWQKSGALLPGFITQTKIGKLTIWKLTHCVVGSKLIASMTRCGLRGMTTEELERLLQWRNESEFGDSEIVLTPKELARFCAPFVHADDIGSFAWNGDRGEWNWNLYERPPHFLAVSR